MNGTVRSALSRRSLQNTILLMDGILTETGSRSKLECITSPGNGVMILFRLAPNEFFDRDEFVTHLERRVNNGRQRLHSLRRLGGGLPGLCDAGTRVCYSFPISEKRSQVSSRLLPPVMEQNYDAGPNTRTNRFNDLIGIQLPVVSA